MHEHLDNRCFLSGRTGSIVGLFAVATLGLVLAGCSSWLGFDGTKSAPPTASAFNQALAKDYDALSRSVTTGNDTSDAGFFSSPFAYLGVDFWSKSPSEALVNAFADKASRAAEGKDVAPEPSNDSASESARARLVMAVEAGEDRFPDDAARAQADYDCWVLDAMVASQASAASQCQSSLGSSLARLEADVQPAPPPPPPPPTEPAPSPALAPAASTDYTVYFDFDSWTLTAEDLAVLTQVVKTVRAGGQTHIAVVGHTDTSGPADYNQKLSVERANVVVEALVDMGAPRKSFKVWGVGETDLAVQTGDGVREPKNRRTVIDLAP
jgi:outer membrane protein OmpA-like peptidoglycan-associated protein/outer membrane murein-binding lipoprotein Lpp